VRKLTEIFFAFKTHTPGWVLKEAKHIYLTTFNYITYINLSVLVPAQSKEYFYGHSPAEIVGSNPTGGMDVCVL